MAITLLDAAATNSDVNISSLSATHTLSSGANRLAIVFAAGVYSVGDPGQPTSVTYGGVTMTHVSTSAYFGQGGGYARVDAYYCLEADLPATGSKTVTVNWSGTARWAQMAVYTIQGAKQDAPESVGTFGGTGTATATADVTSSSGAWALAHASSDNGVTFTPGTGQTELYDLNFANGISSGGSYEEVAAGTNTQTETASTAPYTYAMLVISIAVAGSSVRQFKALLGVGI